MADFIIYDKATGEAKQLLVSVNTPDYSSRADALKVETRYTDLKFLRVVDGAVTTLSKAEQDTITSAEVKEKEDAAKAVTDKIDAIKDVEGVKNYLKEVNYGSII